MSPRRRASTGVDDINKEEWDRCTFQDGEILMQQGDPILLSSPVYMLDKGSVSVRVDDEQVAVLDTGYVGDYGMYAPKRSATVVAIDTVVCWKMDKEIFCKKGLVTTPAVLRGLESTELAHFNGRLCYPMPHGTVGMCIVTVPNIDKKHNPTDHTIPDTMELCVGMKNLEFVVGEELDLLLKQKDIEEKRRKFPGLYDYSSKNGLASASSLRTTVELLTSKIRTAIVRHQARQHGGDIGQMFETFDGDNSGELDKKEFYLGINSLGIEVSRAEIEMLWPILDADKSGKVDLHEFFSFAQEGSNRRGSYIRLREERDKSLLKIGNDLRSQKIKGSTDLARMLASYATRLRKVIRKSGKSSRQWFAEFDGDGSFEIDKFELYDGLKSIGLDITTEELQLIWPALCDDNDLMPYKSWQRFLSGKGFDINEAKAKLNRQLMDAEMDVQDLMRSVEKVQKDRISENSEHVQLNQDKAQRKRKTISNQLPVVPQRTKLLFPRRTFRPIKTDLTSLLPALNEQPLQENSVTKRPTVQTRAVLQPPKELRDKQPESFFPDIVQKKTVPDRCVIHAEPWSKSISVTQSIKRTPEKESESRAATVECSARLDALSRPRGTREKHRPKKRKKRRGKKKYRPSPLEDKNTYSRKYMRGGRARVEWQT